MSLPAFLKKKRTYAILILVILVGGWLVQRGKPVPVEYETAPVERRDLVQRVEVTGSLKPASRIELAFRTGGTIGSVSAKVGDTVKAGQILAQLADADTLFAVRSANAAVSIARANLNQRLAGETTQSIRVAETQVEQARASYEKALADLESAKKTTADAIQTARTNFNTAKNNQNNQNAIVAQTQANAIESARASLLTALGPLGSGLRDGDQIIGVDNTAANQSYLNVLGFLDSGSLPRAKASYAIAKSSKQTAEIAVRALVSTSAQTDVESAALKLQLAIEAVQTYLLDVQRVLASSMTSAYLTSADLDSKKTVIDSDRTSVSAQNSAVILAVQAVKNADLSKAQTVQQLEDAMVNAEIALATAETNAQVQVRNAETTVAIQKAAMDSAQASLDLKKSGPRGVDVEPLRAALQQAQVNAEKAENDLAEIQLLAPVDGIVSEVLPDVGEVVGPNAIVVKLIGTASYEVEAEVPEADIAKITVGQQASITLDAYGDDVIFQGAVTAKDPAETKLQEAIYYKIRIQIDPAGREVKPGMTANVTVTTAESKATLVIPLRAIRTKSDTGQKVVRILQNAEPQERTVTLGLRGDEGRIEIVNGLTEGESVIVGEIKPGVAN